MICVSVVLHNSVDHHQGVSDDCSRIKTATHFYGCTASRPSASRDRIWSTPGRGGPPDPASAGDKLCYISRQEKEKVKSMDKFPCIYGARNTIMPVVCPMIFGSMRQSQVGQVSPAIEAGGAIDIKNASRT